jgi:hypothetical protein
MSKDKGQEFFSCLLFIFKNNRNIASLNNKLMDMLFKNQDQIAQLAPAVMSETHKETLSSNYTHIPTKQLIEDMSKLGWGVTDVKQGLTRKGNAEHKKHLVTFRNPDLKIQSKNGDDVVYPQIVLINSHDGKSSFQFRAGLFRLVCSNGLIICTEDFGQMRMRHSGYSFSQLQGLINEMVMNIPNTIKTLNNFKEKELTEEEKVDFAMRAIQIRFRDEEVKVSTEDVLKSIRNEDESNDLWTVFNVVQEKLVRGGFKYVNRKGKLRRARKITNFVKDIKINEELFELANTYATNIF